MNDLMTGKIEVTNKYTYNLRGVLIFSYCTSKLCKVFLVIQNLRTMSKKEKDHNANIQNPNKGTKGTNKTYDKNQGNRGKQMNPNQKGKK